MSDNDDDPFDTITNMLRKLGKQKVEYPDKLYENRRNTFIRWVFSRRAWFLWVILLTMVLCIVVQNFIR